MDNPTEREGKNGDAADPDSHRGCEVDEHLEPEQPNGAKPFSNGRERNATDTSCGRFSQRMPRRECENATQSRAGMDDTTQRPCDNGAAWGRAGEVCGSRWANFPTVSPVHRGNDGIPFPLDSLTLSPGKWRTEALKAYGNAIVPQVMYEIFRAIEQVENAK